MTLIRHLCPDDLARLASLFRSFPYKAVQQRFQGMDAGVLAEFFARGEARRLEKGLGGGATQRVVESRGQLTGFGALHGDGWHSRFYPWRFGRIAPFLSHAADSEARAALLDALLDDAKRAGFQHLIARVDGSEYDALRLMESRGFYLVDCSLKLSGRMGDVPRAATPSRAKGMRIRRYREGDLEAVRAIAATSHPFNHYYNDPHLSREGSDALFSAWVERCCAGLAPHVFVVEAAGGEVTGFVLYLVPASLNTALGTRIVVLDFVCLASGARGGGVGRWLIGETLQELGGDFDLVELRTSHNNYPALSCYHDLGMRVVSSDLVVHWHAGS